MQRPSFSELAKYHGKATVLFCSGTLAWRDLNPRFYKFRWWVFHEESPIDGPGFLAERYSLCTSDAMALLETLKEDGKPCFLYNSRRRRLGPETPFRHDPESMSHWNWAPALDEDRDPEFEGHK